MTIPGELYQTAIDENHIAIDSRVGDKVHFSIFNHSTGKLHNEFSLDEITPWHTLVGISGANLLLQYFENKKNPDSVSWVQLDWKSKKISQGLKQIEPFDVEKPHWIPSEREEFKPLRKFIGQELVFGCEYLEVSDCIIISYYLSEEKGSNRHLLVIKAGLECLNLVQDRHLKGFAPGSFFTYQNRLIFAREKNEINIYEI